MTDIPDHEVDELTGTLQEVAERGDAECRLCGDVVEGESFGDIFENLADHGERKHEWDDETGWSE